MGLEYFNHCMYTYYIRVEFSGDNVVELLIKGDGGAYVKRKFGIAKARKAIAHYARNDIEIVNHARPKRVDFTEDAETPITADEVVVDADVSTERMQMLLDEGVVTNGEPFPNEYDLRVM